MLEGMEYTTVIKLQNSDLTLPLLERLKISTKPKFPLELKRFTLAVRKRS